MLKHFIKTSWQNLKAKKVFTLLNVLGLAVGIASCWIIYRTVSFEHNYEAFLAPDANIHQVVSDFGTERKLKWEAWLPLFTRRQIKSLVS